MNNNEIKNLLHQYADLKESEKKIKEQIQAINPQITEYMQEKSVEEIDLEDRGTFVMVSKSKWKYPNRIVKMEDELKQEKKNAERTGEAEYEESNYLKFSPLREE